MSPNIPEEDLLLLSRETLASLLASAAAKNPEVALSVIPHVENAKAIIKASWVDELMEEMAELSSARGFDKSFKPSAIQYDNTLNANEFHQFPKLPAELRLRIWRFALPASRILIFIMHRYRGHPRCGQFIPAAKVPVTLQINQESRAETLKYFQLAFSTNGQRWTTYVDFSTDVICFGSVTLDLTKPSVWDSVEGDIEKIQRLVCPHDEFLELTSIPREDFGMSGGIEADSYHEPKFVNNFKSLTEVFVDLERASASLQSGFMSYKRSEYEGKFGHVRRDAWVDETEPESEFKKPLIDEARTDHKQVIERFPDWKAPTLRFGFIRRTELHDRMAYLEKELKTLTS